MPCGDFYSTACQTPKHWASQRYDILVWIAVFACIFHQTLTEIKIWGREKTENHENYHFCWMYRIFDTWLTLDSTLVFTLVFTLDITLDIQDISDPDWQKNQTDTDWDKNLGERGKTENHENYHFCWMYRIFPTCHPLDIQLTGHLTNAWHTLDIHDISDTDWIKKIWERHRYNICQKLENKWRICIIISYVKWGRKYIFSARRGGDSTSNQNNKKKLIEDTDTIF